MIKHNILALLITALVAVFSCPALAVTLAPQGPFRAFDGDGDPCAACKLYTYEAGTSTPKTTYTDSTGGSSNANPTILDSDGYANVWLGDGSYKFVLKDSNDATIWTLDNISGSEIGAFADEVVPLSSSTSITTAHENNLIVASSSPTFSLLSAASAGEGFAFAIYNEGTGVVTIDPNLSETVNDVSTWILGPKASAFVVTDGSEWYATLGGMGVVQSLARGDLLTFNTNKQLIRVPGTTASGDVFYADASLDIQRLPKGTAGQLLKIGAAIPAWATVNGRLLNVQSFTASGTYTPTTGTTSAIVMCVGGGGGGGGADSGGAGAETASGGGGSGGLAIDFVTVSGNITVTIGAAGSAGSTSGGTGGTGGQTSFGSTCVAAGGVGGAGTGSAASEGIIGVGGAAGSASAGDIQFQGDDGANGMTHSSGVASDDAIGGNGGGSFLGGGGRGGNVVIQGGSTEIAAAAGNNYGGGGGGAASTTTTGQAGGLGAPGLVVVLEFGAD